MPLFADAWESPHEASAAFDLLPGWDWQAWKKLLHHTVTVRVSPGAAMILPGAADRAVYIVSAGKLLLSSPDSRSLAEAGAVFGERRFLTGEPQQLGAEALSEAEVLCLTFAAYEIFAAWEPALAVEFWADLVRLMALSR